MLHGRVTALDLPIRCVQDYLWCICRSQCLLLSCPIECLTAMATEKPLIALSSSIGKIRPTVIKFSRFTLTNGLRVLVHEDNSTPMAAVNLLYNVGSKDESPNKTGFAHLFEHLMFGGSANVKDFDEVIQFAGGDSNAFTNADITNFYNIVPAKNLETVFWLESDRMADLNINEDALRVQKQVVVEEFKESCLNQPYGDVWHHLGNLAYKVHPYRWPTIGLVPEHVEDATLEDVKSFFKSYYRPNNAILVISGNVKTAEVEILADRWFGDIPAGPLPKRKLPKEPMQLRPERFENHANVPLDAIYMAFHTPGRDSENFYVSDLLSDILCSGQSSRLNRELVRKQSLFTEIDCYITGNIDPGLMIIEGKPADGIELHKAMDAIWNELELLKSIPVDHVELQKHQNKMESALLFSETSVLNKAINLAYYELIGDAELINKEGELYHSITADRLQQLAKKIFIQENYTELVYRVKK